MSEDEYSYWEKLQNVTQETGGLYDIIPSSISSNLICNENPEEKVLGYFSVSAKSTKRICIKDQFAGIFDPYAKCVSDSFGYIHPGVNETIWLLIPHPCSFPCNNNCHLISHRHDICTCVLKTVSPGMLLRRRMHRQPFSFCASLLFFLIHPRSCLLSDMFTS